MTFLCMGTTCSGFAHCDGPFAFRNNREFLNQTNISLRDQVRL